MPSIGRLTLAAAYLYCNNFSLMEKQIVSPELEPTRSILVNINLIVDILEGDQVSWVTLVQYA